jgi:uncharacterized protein (DUF2141 family)
MSLKNILVSLAMLLCLALSVNAQEVITPQTTPVIEGFAVSGTITFEQKGTIYLSLVTAENYMKDPDTALNQTLELDEEALERKTLPFIFANVPAGVYGLRAFQDTNNNGKLDFYFFGPPAEPVGTTFDVRPSFRAPSFEETKFEVIQNTPDMNFVVK